MRSFLKLEVLTWLCSISFKFTHSCFISCVFFEKYGKSTQPQVTWPQNAKFHKGPLVSYLGVQTTGEFATWKRYIPKSNVWGIYICHDRSCRWYVHVLCWSPQSVVYYHQPKQWGSPFSSMIFLFYHIIRFVFLFHCFSYMLTTYVNRYTV